MGILNIFKNRRRPGQDIVLEAAATLYPDKILIHTIDRVKEGFGISSTNITILPTNIDPEALGSVTRNHLNLTKHNMPIPKDYKQHYREFLKKAGFRSGKEHHSNALHLSIVQRQNQIVISATKNGGYTGKESGFLDLDNAKFSISADTDDSNIGNMLRKGWSKCK